MKQSPTIVCRMPRAAFVVFSDEAARQCRPLPNIIAGAARAFEKLSPAQREEFTIGEPPSIETAASLLGRTLPAPVNRRKVKVAK
jgi:hypothetical protein